MNISHPDTNSTVYKQFISSILDKVGKVELWLIEHKIDYVWNYWLGNHLYRIYIPSKDLLLDFEYYPVSHRDYNYIRINFDDDVVSVLQTIFPETVFDTQDLNIDELSQRDANHFLREQGAAPVYDKSALRLGWSKDNTIYQCVIVKDNKIIANVVRKNCAISYGTYMTLRYLNELYGLSGILFRESLNNSIRHITYQILDVPFTAHELKKKIWWNPTGAKWHIKREDTDKYIPFYYCGYRVYKYC